MFTLLGCRGSSRTRTQTGALQGELLPSETRLLLQLTLRHKHTCNIDIGTERWNKRIAASQIKYSWGDCVNVFIQISEMILNAPSNVFLLTRSEMAIPKTKHKSINTWDFVTTGHQLVLLRPYIMSLCLVFFPWESLHTAQLWMYKVYCGSLFASQCV